MRFAIKVLLLARPFVPFAQVPLVNQELVIGFGIRSPKCTVILHSTLWWVPATASSKPGKETAVSYSIAKFYKPQKGTSSFGHNFNQMLLFLFPSVFFTPGKCEEAPQKLSLVG